MSKENHHAKSDKDYCDFLRIYTKGKRTICKDQFCEQGNECPYSFMEEDAPIGRQNSHAVVESQRDCIIFKAAVSEIGFEETQQTCKGGACKYTTGGNCPLAKDERIFPKRKKDGWTSQLPIQVKKNLESTPHTHKLDYAADVVDRT